MIEAALGHTPYVDMSFEQIVTKKAVNAGVPMLAVNTHGRHFSQVRKHSLSYPCMHSSRACSAYFALHQLCLKFCIFIIS